MKIPRHVVFPPATVNAEFEQNILMELRYALLASNDDKFHYKPHLRCSASHLHLANPSR